MKKLIKNKLINKIYFFYKASAIKSILNNIKIKYLFLACEQFLRCLQNKMSKQLNKNTKTNTKKNQKV